MIRLILLTDFTEAFAHNLLRGFGISGTGTLGGMPDAPFL